MSDVIRVGVLDEQEVVHYGLRACFAELSDIEVFGAFMAPRNALCAIERGEIDVLLMDYMWKSRDTIEFIQSLNARHPGLRVLVFLASPCPTTVITLLETGVHGIVFKHEPLRVCVQAIRLLVSGQRYFCPSIGRSDSASESSRQGTVSDAEAALLSLSSLTHREKEVLRLCISGLTVTRIAKLFCRSLKTVSTQKQAAYRKLGLKSDMDLFRTLARYRI